MTIKRAEIAQWLDKEFDKTKAYVLSAVRGLTEQRFASFLRYNRGWEALGDHSGIYHVLISQDEQAELDWSDVRVQELRPQDVNSFPYEIGQAKVFTPPPRTVTLEVDAEIWEGVKHEHVKAGLIGAFIDSAKVKG